MPCVNASGLPMFGCCIPAQDFYSGYFTQADRFGYCSLVRPSIPDLRFNQWTLARRTTTSAIIGLSGRITQESIIGQDGGTSYTTTESSPGFFDRLLNFAIITFWGGPYSILGDNYAIAHFINVDQNSGHAGEEITVELELFDQLPQAAQIALDLVNSFPPDTAGIGRNIFKALPAPFNSLYPNDTIFGHPGIASFSITGGGGPPFDIPQFGTVSGAFTTFYQSDLSSKITVAAQSMYRRGSKWSTVRRYKTEWQQAEALYLCQGEIQPPTSITVLPERPGFAVATRGTITEYATQAESVC